MGNTCSVRDFQLCVRLQRRCEQSRSFHSGSASPLSGASVALLDVAAPYLDAATFSALPSLEEVLVLGDGKKFHNTVPASHWCLAKSDLRNLRRWICKAIERGQIHPTDRDAFDPRDRCFGPTIYTINEQFIKPRSEKAGGMSWALMCRSKGLPCDLFVTHAWSEGIFEFIDKLLASWPKSASHAYCCMFSNPQCEDIIKDVLGGLGSPEDSPFAKALESAPVMLIVPNRNCSIYSRKWCAYEAYLAWKRGKKIFLAHGPLDLRLRFAFLLCALILGNIYCNQLTHFVMIYGSHNPAAFHNRGMDPLRWWFDYSLLFILIGVATKDFGKCWWCRHVSTLSNWVGAVCTGAAIQCAFLTLNSITRPTLTMTEFAAACVYFFFAEHDIQHLRREETEANLLAKGFTTIGDAKCTSPHDAGMIDAAIGDRTKDVDEMVQQILESGMSTPSLQKLCCHGIHVQDAGYFSYASAWIMWVIWLSLSVWGCHGYSVGQALGLLLAIIWAFRLPSMDLDVRTFSAQAVTRVTLISLLVAFGFGVPQLPREYSCCATLTNSAFASIVSWLGPSYLASKGCQRLVQIIYKRPYGFRKRLEARAA